VPIVASLPLTATRVVVSVEGWPDARVSAAETVVPAPAVWRIVAFQAIMVKAITPLPGIFILILVIKESALRPRWNEVCAATHIGSWTWKFGFFKPIHLFHGAPQMLDTLFDLVDRITHAVLLDHVIALPIKISRGL
jgi:hypothetical protein